MPQPFRRIPLDGLTPDDKNANRGTKRGRKALSTSLEKFGAMRSITIDKAERIMAGNKTVEAARAQGYTHVLIVPSDGKTLVAVQRTDLDLTTPEGRAAAIADNRTSELNLDWDPAILTAFGKEFDLEQFGFSKRELSIFSDQAVIERDAIGINHGALSAKFLVPPFTVFDQLDPTWKRRRDMWLSLGMDRTANPEEQQEGMTSAHAFRRAGQGGFSGARMRSASPSLVTTGFDPVLAEIAYTWWCPTGGKIVDPFCGGPIRGVVASKLGYRYQGIDVRPEQIAANRQNAETFKLRGLTYTAGDSRKVLAASDDLVDFVFSCPPYAGLEVYSDLPDDISTMKYPQFLESYREIIRLACARLRDQRFACFVVGEARDKKTGCFVNFVPDTVRAFTDAGLSFYNEAIIVSPVGSLAFACQSYFPNYRKLGKRHQNVLVFYKGDPAKIPEAFGHIDISASLALFGGTNDNTTDNAQGKSQPKSKRTPAPVEARRKRQPKRN